MKKYIFKNIKEAIQEPFCYDCNKKIIIENDETQNGNLLEYEEEDDTFIIFKCNSCFKKNKALINYKNCEVYARIVGYLRPINSVNIGKKQEIEERKLYKFKDI